MSDVCHFTITLYSHLVIVFHFHNRRDFGIGITLQDAS